jgi:hypothetical protein
MTQIVLTNCKAWVGKYDFSGKLNAIALDDAPDVLDNTTFGCTAKNRKKGLDVVTASLAGFWESEPDSYCSDFILTNVPITLAPETTVGSTAYSFLSRNTEYKFGGSIGEMGKFSMKAESVGTKMIQGCTLENGIVAKSITGVGAASLYGTVGATQYLYGALHVISAATVAGDTLNVIIESDDVATFLGTPSTRIAFTQVLGNGGATYQWATPVAGPIADTWWRTAWTIVNVSAPLFGFVVFMGIK